jgi:hypothetical protein
MSKVDPSSPLITLPDGTTAHVTQLDSGQHSIQTFEEISGGGGEGTQIIIADEHGKISLK